MAAVEGPFGFPVADDEAAWGCHIVGAKLEGEGWEGKELKVLVLNIAC